MPTAVAILTMLKQTLSQASALDYVSRIQIGPYPVPDPSDRHVISLSPSDVITDRATYPDEATLIVIVNASTICSNPTKAYHDPDAKTVLDMFEDLRFVLHDNDPLPGILDIFISSAKFDIKKHSWGAKERLDTHPQYACEVYLNILFQTVQP